LDTIKHLLEFKIGTLARIQEKQAGRKEKTKEIRGEEKYSLFF
jgi:hypothetical protein